MTATVIKQRSRSYDHLRQGQHSVILGSTRFWCIQPDCDGTHHFYCSCEH
jgi:hypothetical protein